MVPQSDLQQTFERIWSQIRGAKLYAGQPRNEAYARSKLESHPESGMSEATASDDLLGLVRGFLYAAGSRSLLVSLWNVNDESTAALMVSFYEEWQKGASKAAALRKAMLAVRKSHPHPFYWAPLLLVGNP